MKTLTSIAAILALGAPTAFAGSYAPAQVEGDVVVVDDMGMEGGLSTTAAVAGGLLLVGVIAAVASGGDDDDDTRHDRLRRRRLSASGRPRPDREFRTNQAGTFGTRPFSFRKQGLPVCRRPTLSARSPAPGASSRRR